MRVTLDGEPVKPVSAEHKGQPALGYDDDKSLTERRMAGAPQAEGSARSIRATDCQQAC